MRKPEKIKMILDTRRDYVVEEKKLTRLENVTIKYPQLGSIDEFYLLPLEEEGRFGTICGTDDVIDRCGFYKFLLYLFNGWIDDPELFENKFQISVECKDETHYIMYVTQKEIEFFLTKPIGKEEEVYTIIYDPRQSFGFFDLNLLNDLLKNNPELGSFKDYTIINIFDYVCCVKTEELSKLSIEDYETFLNYALNQYNPDLEDHIINIKEFDSDHYQLELEDCLIEVYEITPR